MDEVRLLFTALNLHVFLEAVSKMKIDGRTLFLCDSSYSLKELELNDTMKGRVLLRILRTYRDEGVPATMLDPTGNMYIKYCSIVPLLKLSYSSVDW